MQETQIQSLCWEDSLEKEMATHSSILPGKSHGQRTLVGYNPCKESATTECLSTCTTLIEASTFRSYRRIKCKTRDYYFGHMVLLEIRAFESGGGSDSKDFACNVGGPGLIPELGKSPGEGNGFPLQYSCLENSMDRRA